MFDVTENRKAGLLSHAGTITALALCCALALPALREVSFLAVKLALPGVAFATVNALASDVALKEPATPA